MSEDLKVCENMEEFISSKDFSKSFVLVARRFETFAKEKDFPYDLNNVLGIIQKIQFGQALKNQERIDILSLLENEEFKKSIKIIYRKVRGFSLEEAHEFLKKFPVESIIEGVKESVSYNIAENLEKNITILEEVRIGEYIFLKASMGDKEIWTNPGVLLDETGFLYNTVDHIHMRGETVLYQATIGDKKEWIEFGEDKKEEDFLLDTIGPTEYVGHNIYYKGKIGDKYAYVEVGKEIKEEDFIFDNLGIIERYPTGNVLYEAELNGKYAFLEYGKEVTKKDLKRFSKSNSKPREKLENTSYQYTNSLGIKKTHTFENGL